MADGWELVEDAETVSIHVYILLSTHVDVPLKIRGKEPFQQCV